MIKLIDVSTIKILLDYVLKDSVFDELVENIRVNGLLKPLLVTKRPDYYLVFDGHKRFKACLELNYKEILCKIMTLSDENLVDTLKTGSTQHVSPSLLEQKEALLKIITNHTRIQLKDLAKKLNRNANWILNTLEIRALLHIEVKRNLLRGKLSLYKGYILSRLDLKDQINFLNDAYNLNVSELLEKIENFLT